MADTLALEDLYAGVVALMGAENAPCLHTFGWREEHRQFAPRPGDPLRRAVWIPGDENGAVGDCNGPRWPGRLPARPLFSIDELFRVRLTACDLTDPENEAKQYRACVLLRDDWLRAVYHVARGTFEIRALKWDVSKSERRYGASLVVTGIIQNMTPDEQVDIAPADTHAAISTTQLDVIELSTAP